MVVITVVVKLNGMWKGKGLARLSFKYQTKLSIEYTFFAIHPSLRRLSAEVGIGVGKRDEKRLLIFSFNFFR